MTELTEKARAGRLAAIRGLEKRRRANREKRSHRLARAAAQLAGKALTPAPRNIFA